MPRVIQLGTIPHEAGVTIESPISPSPWGQNSLVQK